MKTFLISDLAQEPVSHNANILKRVFLKNGEIPHITNFATSCFPVRETAPAHSHSDMYEIFVVQSGCGTFIIDSETFDLTSQTVVVIQPNEIHEIQNNSTEELVLLYFGVQI